jgi:hypothetical protein
MRPPPRTRQGLTPTAMALAAAFAFLPAAAHAAISYYNARFGFSLRLPGNHFVAGEPRNPESGGLWQTRDGRVRVLAVAAANESGSSLEAYRKFVMETAYKTAKFDYLPIRDTWFVLSGEMDGRIFYERISFVCEGRYIYGWQMTYPAAEKRRWDPIVETIHRSYRLGRGEDGRCGPARNPT